MYNLTDDKLLSLITLFNHKIIYTQSTKMFDFGSKTFN